MVVYLDLVFLLNFVADALALYVTARLSGLSLRSRRVIVAALIGGGYGVVCSFISLVPAGYVLLQTLAAASLVLIVFGKQKVFLRLFLLFFVLSCAMGGVMLAFAQSFTRYGVTNTLHCINWKVFLLAGGLCYLLLSVIFRGSASHAVSGQLCHGEISRRNRKVSLNVLFDTGHTLSDPVSGAPVMVVWLDALRGIWSEEEWAIVSQLSKNGETWCFEKMDEITPGTFRLIPYRAVGVNTGMLLCFTAESGTINHQSIGQTTVAISSTPLADGGGCNALWGSSIGREVFL